MPSFLEKIKREQDMLQDNIKAKLERKEALTDEEIGLYSLTDEDKEVLDIFKKLGDGQHVPGFSLKDFLSTPQAATLIPRVVIGTMRKA